MLHSTAGSKKRRDFLQPDRRGWQDVCIFGVQLQNSFRHDIAAMLILTIFKYCKYKRQKTMQRWWKDRFVVLSDLLEGSGLDVGVAGVGLAAAGRSAEVPRDAAIWQGKSRLESFSGYPVWNHKPPNISLVSAIAGGTWPISVLFSCGRN